MKKMIVNGKTITTNFGESGARTIVKGNDLPNYRTEIARRAETEEQFLERLVARGYSRIRFAEVATRITGFHDLIAYCRR